MIENYPPKDIGDNEDGISFANTGNLVLKSFYYKFNENFKNQILFFWIEFTSTANQSSVRSKQSRTAIANGPDWELLHSACCCFSRILRASMRLRAILAFPERSVIQFPVLEPLFFQGTIKMRSLNLRQVLGHGTMHTKFIISDSEHFYIGSANLDWRSLNQVNKNYVLKGCIQRST